MAGAFQAPKGTLDILPGGEPFASEQWTAAIEALTRPARCAGYGLIEFPIFEDTALFKRGAGETTDVVTKEMFTFTDRGGRSLTLRPEGTAPVVRAVNEHGLHRGQLPVKLYYVGPMFRAENVQAGRYRQFVQVGAEALGLDDPAVDAEMITVGMRAFEAVRLPGVALLLNSMGDANCRPAYTEELRSFLADELKAAGVDDPDTIRRLELNPLRILDDKRPEVAAVVEKAPVLADRLCDDCRAHYDAVREHLTDLGVAWSEAPRLVRGFDYYRRTTFEYQHGRLGAQNAVGGGGRYDGLSEVIGGDPLPAIGWSLGVERILLALRAEGVQLPSPRRCAVFVVPLGRGSAAKRRAVVLTDALRATGVATDMAYGDRGLKGAMKAADRSGAVWAVVLGERDLQAGVAQLKNLATGEQTPVPLADVVSWVSERATE